jgi:hypothetical protein
MNSIDFENKKFLLNSIDWFKILKLQTLCEFKSNSLLTHSSASIAII